MKEMIGYEVYLPYTIEEFNNVLTFRKNGIILGEIPIPNNYKLIKERETLFSLNSTIEKMPAIIPKGYSAPERKSGYYIVKDTRNFQEDKGYQIINKQYQIICPKYQRMLAYIDTTVVDEEDYYDCMRRYGYFDLSIPNSFWMQVDWRNYLPYGGDLSLKDTLLAINNFDLENNSECITMEEVAYLSYIKNVRNRRLYTELKSNIQKIFENEPEDWIWHACVKMFSLPNDNWAILAENNQSDYSLFHIDSIDEDIDNGRLLMREYSTNSSMRKWGIPVIHTSENLELKKTK